MNKEAGGSNRSISLLLLAMMRRIEFSRLIYITQSAPKDYTNRLEQQHQKVIKGQDMKLTESSSFIIFFLILAKDL